MSEEAEIMKKIEAAGSGNTEALDTRLGQIHEQLVVIGAAAAEAKARRM